MECQHLEVQLTLASMERPSKVQHLLDQFKGVFQMPKGLSPTWDHEHSIVLQDGMSPINVRPY